MAHFTDLKKLVEQLDLKRIAHLAHEVDLVKAIGLLSQLEPEDLAHLASTLKARHGKPESLPKPHGDFYEFGGTLSKDDQALRMRVRKFMHEEVAPIANEYWLKGRVSHASLIPETRGARHRRNDLRRERFSQAKLRARRPRRRGDRARRCLDLYFFWRPERARDGLDSALRLGRAEGRIPAADAPLRAARRVRIDRARYVGSGIAGGLATTCKQEGDTWILNGKKKWIGNATFADFTHHLGAR